MIRLSGVLCVALLLMSRARRSDSGKATEKAEETMLVPVFGGRYNAVSPVFAVVKVGPFGREHGRSSGPPGVPPYHERGVL
jgi:hypothetical protein